MAESIKIGPAINKLGNLKELLPNHGEMVHEFGTMLAESLIKRNAIHANYPPPHVVCEFQTALKDLRRGICGYTYDKLEGRLAQSDDATYGIIQSAFPDIVNAVFPPEEKKPILDLLKKIERIQ